MTRDTDLIRRALLSIRELNMTAEDENGHRWANSDLIEQEVAAALTALSAPVQEPPSPGVTAGTTGPERIGIISDGMGCWALAHRDEADHAVHYIRADLATPAPVVPAEGPISTLEMVYRNMPDIPELPEAYQPRNIARSLAALRSAPPVGVRVTGWQPIETAPKDGVTEVLMYDPDLGMAVWPSTNSPWPNVTHWMPLPEPPAALLPAGEGE